MPISLPPLVDVLLSRDVVADLFNDVATCASNTEVVCRGKPVDANIAANAPPKLIAADLKQAHAWLLAGTITAVQLRYQYADATWCDTLTPAGQEFRLVRINQRDAHRACDEDDNDVSR